MGITVVGSVAFDSIETPAGKRERCLGGAATYFALAASFFTEVRVIAVVGEDFGAEEEAVFTNAKSIRVELSGHGKEFFLGRVVLGKLERSQNPPDGFERLCVFEPKIPDAYPRRIFISCEH